MSHSAPQVTRVVLVDPDGRLDRVRAALGEATPSFECVTVDAAESVSEVSEADVVIVHHAPATEELAALDGIEQYRTVRETVEVPVVVYTVTADKSFINKSLDRGASAISVPPQREELLARRIKNVVGEPLVDFSAMALLETLLDSYPEQLFLKDRLGRFVAMSSETAAAFGFDRRSATGLTDYAFFRTDLADELYQEEKAIMESEDSMLNNVEHFVDDDGYNRWVSTTKAPWYDTDGEVVGIIGSTREVSPQKRREQLVQALHESSYDLFRAGTKREVASITVDIIGGKRMFPPAEIALFEEGTLRPVARTIDTDIFDEYEERFQEAAETGEILFRREDGGVDTAWKSGESYVAAFVPLGEQGVIGFVPQGGPLQPAHEELIPILTKQVTAALDGIDRERLAHRNEQLEEFASIVSHDLRNPLEVASGHLELLAEDVDSPHVEQVREELDRMDGLIEGLLGLSRKGKIVEEPVAVQLESVVAEAWQHVDAPEATLDAAVDLTVEADPDRLPELFENLFRNAVEHSTGPVTVRVGELADGFFVEDDGPGIPAADRERVFEVGHSEGGTGYGLYIVATIAEAHGWDVSVAESAEGGARFEFTDVAIEG